MKHASDEDDTSRTEGEMAIKSWNVLRTALDQRLMMASLG